MTNAFRSTGSKRVREALAAQAALAGQTAASPPPDAFERGLWQGRRYRDTGSPASQSRPWLLWFLVLALSGSIGAAIFWSDTSISRDGSTQLVGSDSAWRGVIRHQRPERVATTRLVTPVSAEPSATSISSTAPAVAPVTTIVAAYTSTVETARDFAEQAGLVPDQNAADEPAAEPAAKQPPTSSPIAPPQSVAPSRSADLLGDPTVLSIQGLLSKNGFKPGPADGVMGSRTRTAILAWQLQQGLPTTGRASKAVLEQLLDPAKARGAAARIPLGELAQAERKVLESWCTTGRNVGDLLAYYQCMGEEVAKISAGLRMPELPNNAAGNLDAFATARLLCADQAGAAPQSYFKCLHGEIGRDKPLFVME